MIYKILLFVFLHVNLFAGFPTFLQPDEAFRPDVKVVDGKILVKLDLAQNVYIYKSSLGFEVKDSDIVAIDKIIYPDSINHDGDEVFEKSPLFKILLKKTKDLNNIIECKFILKFQGCSSAGLCYEPIQKIYNLKIDTAKLKNSKNQSRLKNIKKENSSEVDSIANTLKSGNIWLVIVTFFIFGLLLSLTPCVFPMIPIISGLIVSQGKNITTRKAFFLSVIYVLSMAVAYTIAGIIAGTFGSNLQATLQNPYVVVGFSFIFVALALSMFGFYELKLPDSLVSKVSQKGQDKGGIIGVAIMGFLSALIVGPCVAAPLAGALVYIGQTGDAFLGGLALFVMSLGMGLPLIIIGTGAGKFMPKPGNWMTMVNAVFGILMLGVAIWMLDKILEPYFMVLLWSILGFGSAIYFGVFDKNVHILKKTVAFVLFLYSLALFIGAMAGNVSYTKPLEFLHVKAVEEKQAKEQGLKFISVSSLDELNNLLEKNKGKKIMIDFWAKWCTSCKELEEVTFKNKDVQKALENYLLIRADVTNNNASEKKLSKKYGVFGPPVMIFIDENSNQIKEKTIVGYVPPKKFLEIINK